MTLLPLPSYAPELNPMENVWQYLRGNKLSQLVWDNYQAIVAACKSRLKLPHQRPATHHFDRVQILGIG
jgi:transposase